MRQASAVSRADVVRPAARPWTDGDEIEAPNGRRYRIRNVSATGSPAADAMVICELERVFS